MTDTDIVERLRFPVLGSKGATVDWQLVADHGKQANTNHYQTVKRLAERGGLSWCELHAVLHNRPWQKMDENTAIIECRALEAQYLNADTITALRQQLAETKAALLDTAASLAASISLLEKGGKAAKKAAPSDRMFDQMVVDYTASLDRARAALAKMETNDD